MTAREQGRRALRRYRAGSGKWFPVGEEAALLRDAEELLASRVDSGGCGVPNEPYALLLGLVVHGGWITTHRQTWEPAQGELLEAVTRAAECEEWEPLPRWPFTKAEMKEAADEMLRLMGEECEP